MARASCVVQKISVTAVISLVIAVAAWVLFTGEAKQREWSAASEAALRRPTGYPQLVSSDPMPMADGMMGGEMCQWVPASTNTTLVAALQQEQMAANRSAPALDEDRPAVDADREPIRMIRDTYPTYSAVAVDVNTNEVYLQDENLFGFKVFNRLDNTPPNATMTEPKRMVGGLRTKLEFNCGLYLDQNTGDVYSVNNDTVNTLVIFGREARGNVPPKRELATPHGTFGIAVDEQNQELFLTIQHDNAVVVYNKMAADDEAPLRLLQGDRTELEDPHGIAVDSKNNWMFVSNHGSVHQVRPDVGPDQGDIAVTGLPTQRRERKENWPLDRDRALRGSGQSDPPSISIYSIKAEGDTPPLRVIEGPETQLNWPAAMFVDSERGELYVANDADDSVLVFRMTDSGDVAPTRVIKGPKTGIKNPTGIFVDLKNDEMWVSNMGNHSATVFPRAANGDVAPLRTIRSAPLGKQALAIGNPGAAGYDSKREEILVPN